MESSQQRPLLGITLKIISVAGFTCMAALIKLAGQLPPGQIVFFRSFFALLLVLGYLAVRGQLEGAFKTKRPFVHMARGLIGVMAMSLTFYGLSRLPLPEAIAIGYARPLAMVALSALILGEVVRLHRWSAVIIGLIGVLIITAPKFSLLGSGDALGQEQALAAAATFIAAFLVAIVMIVVRSLIKTERTPTIVIYFSITATLASLLSLPLGWANLAPWQYITLIAAGGLGGIAQILLTESYRHAEVSIVAPFEYTSVLLGITLGYFVFSEMPTITTMIGSMVVVSAGLYIIYRERKLGVKRTGKSRSTTPPK